jgi:transcriptional regulator with XRE-family HTH domain
MGNYLSKGVILPITGEQLRAARAIVRLEQSELALEAGVSVDTVKRLERIVGPLSANVTTIESLQHALERAGVIFVSENGEGPGVRLRKKHDNHDVLTREIDEIEGELATSADEPPQTPQGGMQRLERAHKRETVKKLKNKRTKLVKARK